MRCSMKVGDLIQMRSERKVREHLPIGMVIEQKIEAEFAEMPGYFWNDILWDDGTISGCWSHELRKVA